MTTGLAMGPEAATDFYGPGYFHGGDYEDYPSTERVAKRNFVRFAQRLLDLKSSGRLLEIGCAYGYFLDVARRHWEVEGLDVSPVATQACAGRFPGAVHCADLLSAALPRGAYDVIAGWDVIEHVDQPREYAARCFELLRPGGIVALTTGDVSSTVARLLGRRWRLMTPPSHLTFFSRAGMGQMLADAGLEDVAFGTAGYERALSFVIFRLIRQPALVKKLRSWRTFARFLDVSFYLDVGDIMWVVGRRRS